MEASPNAPRPRTRSLTPMAKMMFSRAIFRVWREMRMAVLILEGSSVIMTISAASIAASEPMPPIAMPISERASTGASLMPSPTKTSLPRRCGGGQKFFNFVNFVGRQEFGVYQIHSQSAANVFADTATVSGEHNRLADAAAFEC